MINISPIKNPLIGLTASQAVNEIVASCKEINSIFLSKYTPPPLLQERIDLNKEELEFINDSMALRDEYSLPFWNSVMLKCFNNGMMSQQILKEALFHKTNHGSEIVITRQNVLDGKIDSILESTSDLPWFSVTSEVKVQSETMHIPLLDFHCPKNRKNDNIVIEVSHLLFPNGFIVLDSENSYHCYGLTLVSEKQLLDILSKALLFSPIIDGAYIAHQILERRCCLRISKGGNQKKQPTVIHYQQ